MSAPGNFTNHTVSPVIHTESKEGMQLRMCPDKAIASCAIEHWQGIGNSSVL